MPLSQSQFAINAIQWINIKADPTDPTSADLWLYTDPAFVNDYPDVLRQVREAGFDAVMMEVLATQTLQNYAGMLTDAGLKPAPGYAQVKLPSDFGVTLHRGTAEWAQWFNDIRRKAEESNYFGLTSLFIAPEVNWDLPRTATTAAVGAEFDQHRLDELVEILTEACEILKAEGIRPGLHNHVGTWVETEQEISYVLDHIDDSLLGASFDVGHLEWAGIDAADMLTRYQERLVDLHLKDLDLAVAQHSRENPTSYSATMNGGLFAEPGLGTLDLDRILGALDTFTGWVIIEVDKATMDPFQSALHTGGWLRETIPA